MPRDGGDADVSVVRRRALLRVPSDERVRRRRHGRDRRRAAPDDVREQPKGPNDGGTPTLDRWTVDKAAGKVREERLDDRGQEFPRVNETLLMSQHRYGYAVEIVNTDSGFDSTHLLKHDLRVGYDRGARLRQRRSRRASSSSCRPARATSEDDGYLMGFVYDPTRDSSDFVVLDAHDVAAEPVATVRLPRGCPSGSTATGSPTHSPPYPAYAGNHGDRRSACSRSLRATARRARPEDHEGRRVPRRAVRPRARVGALPRGQRRPRPLAPADERRQRAAG